MVDTLDETRAAVDNSTWDGSAAMSRCAQSDDPAGAYAAICAGRRDGDPALQSTWALPHHSNPGDPPNAAGVRNSLSRLPQTQGLNNTQAAERHLQAHLADIQGRAEEAGETFEVLVPAEDIEVRDLAKREVDMRLLPWDKRIETKLGPEEFRAGAFDGRDPQDVYLYGTGHEARFGIGQDGAPKAIRVPIGRATKLANRPDGQHATFRIARTAAGDEALGLMADGIVSGVSIEFAQIPGGTDTVNSGGRRVRIHNRALLMGATPTHQPAYGDQAAVLAVRSHEEGQMADATPTPQPEQAPAIDHAAIADQIRAAFQSVEARAGEFQEKLLTRLEAVEEQARSSIVLPGAPQPKTNATLGQWASIVLRMLSGDRVGNAEMREIDDVVTTDNAGVVPPTFLAELIGVIDPRRPFLQSTRRLPTPSTGLKLTVPKITQRPEVGIQTQEKAELPSRTTKIVPVDFDAKTIGGAGDLSLQIIKRSSPEFLTLWLELLAEAYSVEAEEFSVGVLLDAMGGVGNADSLDPENLAFGDAFVNSFDAIRRGPDTLWLSTKAVGEFIDAKATTTNQPLYNTITADINVPGGITGTIQGLRLVHVPALDAHGAYAIVGPSSGFAWAEDGSYTLQVDVPAKAGRDVALVSILWAAPWYPAAFTAYNVAS